MRPSGFLPAPPPLLTSTRYREDYQVSPSVRSLPSPFQSAVMTLGRHDSVERKLEWDNVVRFFAAVPSGSLTTEADGFGATGPDERLPCWVLHSGMTLPGEILEEAAVLFRDTRPEDIEVDEHADFVIARVLDFGSLRSVRSLLRLYGRDRLRRFFREGGASRVSRRTIPLWMAFLNLTADECTPRSSHRRSSPFWSA